MSSESIKETAYLLNHYINTKSSTDSFKSSNSSEETRLKDAYALSAALSAGGILIAMLEPLVGSKLLVGLNLPNDIAQLVTQHRIVELKSGDQSLTWGDIASYSSAVLKVMEGLAGAASLTPLGMTLYFRGALMVAERTAWVLSFALAEVSSSLGDFPFYRDEFKEQIGLEIAKLNEEGLTGAATQLKALMDSFKYPYSEEDFNLQKQRIFNEMWQGIGNDLLVSGSVSYPVLDTSTLSFYQGTDGYDMLYARSPKGDVFHAKQGDDHIYGSEGNDVYVWSPGDGLDTIVHVNTPGFGLDTLFVTDAPDYLRFQVSNRDGALSIKTGSGEGAEFLALFQAVRGGTADLQLGFSGGATFSIGKALRAIGPSFFFHYIAGESGGTAPIELSTGGHVVYLKGSMNTGAVLTPVVESLEGFLSMVVGGKTFLINPDERPKFVVYDGKGLPITGSEVDMFGDWTLTGQGPDGLFHKYTLNSIGARILEISTSASFGNDEVAYLKSVTRSISGDVTTSLKVPVTHDGAIFMTSHVTTISAVGLKLSESFKVPEGSYTYSQRFGTETTLWQAADGYRHSTTASSSLRTVEYGYPAFVRKFTTNLLVANTWSKEFRYEDGSYFKQDVNQGRETYYKWQDANGYFVERQWSAQDGRYTVSFGFGENGAGFQRGNDTIVSREGLVYSTSSSLGGYVTIKVASETGVDFGEYIKNPWQESWRYSDGSRYVLLPGEGSYHYFAPGSNSSETVSYRPMWHDVPSVEIDASGRVNLDGTDWLQPEPAEVEPPYPSFPRPESALSMSREPEDGLMPSSALLSVPARNDDFLLFGSGGQWTA